MSEFLQIAQVLADLSTLQSAEPQPANALLSANKTLAPRFVRQNSQGVIPTYGEQPKFDKFGRRILRAPPQLTRANSSFSSAAGTGSNTPVPSSSPEETDVDFTRAKRLLELYSERDKLDDSGLTRAKERVDKVMETSAKKDLEEREKAARGRSFGVGQISSK